MKLFNMTEIRMCNTEIIVDRFNPHSWVVYIHIHIFLVLSVERASKQ